MIDHPIEEQAKADLVASGARAAKRQDADEQIDADASGPLGAVFDSDPAERFRYGIETFLDGLRHQLADPAEAARRHRT